MTQIIDYQPTSPNEEKYCLVDEWEKKLWSIARFNDGFLHLRSDDPELLLEVNAFNAAYDGLPCLKMARLRDLKEEASRRGELVYGVNIGGDTFELFIKYAMDVNNRYQAKAGAPPARLVQLSQILTRFEEHRAAINAHTNNGNQNDLSPLVALKNYDLTTGWPV